MSYSALWRRRECGPVRHTAASYRDALHRIERNLIPPPVAELVVPPRNLACQFVLETIDFEPIGTPDSTGGIAAGVNRDQPWRAGSPVTQLLANMPVLLGFTGQDRPYRCVLRSVTEVKCQLRRTVERSPFPADTPRNSKTIRLRMSTGTLCLAICLSFAVPIR